jgi:tight adherence protein B
MRTRPIIVGVVAALAAVLALAAPALSASPRLKALDAEFPDRAYVLSLPQKQALATGEVAISENGEAVSGGTLLPANSLGMRGFSTVLVIDASNSMRGEPIVAAMRAARAFAAQRPDGQGLGIVTFADKPTTTLPLTTDGMRVDAALETAPALSAGTAMRDATLAAVRMLKADKVAHGSIVVLSDGADTSSRAELPAALEAARGAGIRVYGVGLESDEFESGALRTLATETGGVYTAATSPDSLEGIFDRLGVELSNQYVLRYRSLVGPRERVQVEAAVRGHDLAATAAYTSPALAGAPIAPYQRSAIERFVGSPVAVLLITLLCAALVGGGVLVLLRHRGGGVLERVGRFVPATVVADPDADPGLTPEGGRGWRRFSGSAWLERLRVDLDVGGVDIPAERLVLMTAVGTGVAMWVFVLASGTALAAMLGLTVPFCVRAFADQLPDNIQVVASAMRAGQSFVGALSILIEEAGSPSQDEFARAISDERLGMPIEEALSRVAKRMRSEELEYVGLVARLQAETGGNTADVLDRLVETLRARSELRRLVRTLTSQGRLASYVIGALPIVILAAVTVLNRDYANLLYETPAGHAMLVMSGCLLALGSYVLRRIVDIKV